MQKRLIPVIALFGGALALAAGRGTADEPKTPPSASLSIRPGAQEPRLARWAMQDPPAWGPTSPGADVGSGAGGGLELTLAEIESTALSHHPTLVQAARRIEALRGKYLQVGLHPNPVIGYVGEEINDEGSAGQQGMFFGQQITTAGKLRLSRAVVGHEIDRARQEWIMQQRRVINDARTAAYTAVAAQRALSLAEQLVRIGQEGQQVAEQLLKAQEVSRVDLLQARIEANSAYLQRDNAGNDVRAAWRSLAIAMGTPGLNPTRVEDRLDDALPELLFDDALARLLAASPEVARARAEVGRAQCALAQQRAEQMPNFDLEAGIRYNTATDDTVASVAVGMPLKIFDRNQGNIYRAQSELAAAGQEVRRVELSLRDRLADAFRQYANARHQVDRYRGQILPDAKDSLELVRQGYRLGELGYLELLTGQRTYFRANLAYVGALRDLWIGHATIDGLLLSGGLKPVGE